MTAAAFCLIILFAGCVWYVGAPLYWATSGSKSKTASKPLEDLHLRKDEVLSTLKELDLDHRMKKISDEDFESVYAETFEKGKTLLQQIERYHEPEAKEPVQSAPQQSPHFQGTC